MIGRCASAPLLALALLAFAARCSKAAAGMQQGMSPGFYVHPQNNRFLQLAKQITTDKVTTHNYDALYGKYLELMGRRTRVQRIFEIGLGCIMDYGPGRSAQLWRRYLPHATVWMAEYDAACVARHARHLQEMGVHVVTGDQADPPTLRRWINATGGDFDVIVDDGGHTSMQQYNSFMLLFLHALKPGGIYVIEDLQVSRSPSFIDGDRKHVMIEVIRDWLEALVLDPGDGLFADETQPPPPPLKWPLPPGLRSIDCFRASCVFTKCYDDDARCDSPRYDQSLKEYGFANG